MFEPGFGFGVNCEACNRKKARFQKSETVSPTHAPFAGALRDRVKELIGILLEVGWDRMI